MSIRTTDERLREICVYTAMYGEQAASNTYTIRAESVPRFMREFRKRFPEEFAKLDTFKKLNSKYSNEALQALSNSVERQQVTAPALSFKGAVYRFAIATDTHMGSVYFNPGHWQSFCTLCEELKIDVLYHAGDISEGFSHRPGHFNEMMPGLIGFNAQKEFAIEQLSKFKGDIYAIDGNHDRWYQKQNGALIVPDIAKELPNFHFLGHDEGDQIVNGVKIKLWHGEDGSSYATSYRIQKVVESLTGGEKPGIMIFGHVHKMGYFIERNIHCISGGCFSGQSHWMRSKRLAAHEGFWLCEATIENSEVKALKVEWFPIYRG